MNRIFLPMLSAALIAVTPLCAQKKEIKKEGDKKDEKKEVIIKRGPGMHHEGLNLTDEQEKKMEQIHLKTGKETRILRNRIAEKKAHLKTELSMDNPNMGEVNKTVDEIHSFKAELQKKQIASRMEIRSMLTEEQRAKFDMHYGDDEGMMRMRMHRGGNSFMFNFDDEDSENHHKKVIKKIHIEDEE